MEFSFSLSEVDYEEGMVHRMGWKRQFVFLT